MHTERVRDAMEALLTTKPEVADRDEPADHVRVVRELAAQDVAEPPTSLLANHVAQSGKPATVLRARPPAVTKVSGNQN